MARAWELELAGPRGEDKGASPWKDTAAHEALARVRVYLYQYLHSVRARCNGGEAKTQETSRGKVEGERRDHTRAIKRLSSD